MIHHTHQQGSQEWLQARKGVITGSRFKDARDRLADKPEKTDKKTGEVTPAQRGAPSAKQIGYAQDTARERVGWVVPPTFQNAAMKTGQVQEPHARMAYEALTGNLVQEVGFITTDDGMFGLSPDGLIDHDGVLEVKTMVSSSTLFEAVADGDISEYIDQCNGYLWLLGRQWVDLVLWAPDLEPMGLSMTIRRITRDENAIEALEADLMAFAALAKSFEDKLRAKAENSSALPIAVAAIEAEKAPALTTKTLPQPAISPTRVALNAQLDRLGETELLRVLNFVRSRYGELVAA